MTRVDLVAAYRLARHEHRNHVTVEIERSHLPRGEFVTVAPGLMGRVTGYGTGNVVLVSIHVADLGYYLFDDVFSDS